MLLADVASDLKRTAIANHYADLGYVPKLDQWLLTEAVLAGKRVLGHFTPPQHGKSYSIAKLAGAFWVFPDTRVWIVAPTYEDGSKEFDYIWQDWEKIGCMYTAKVKHRNLKGDMRIELKNGSWVQVISANEQENLRREQLDIVIYAEASKLPANLHQQFVYPRVERRRGLTFVPTTFKGHNWVHTDIRCKSLPVKEGTFTWGPWVNGRREMIGGDPNPDYDPEYWSCQASYVEEFGDVLVEGEFTKAQIENARKRLPAPMFAEAFGGEAASYAGLIYGNFRPHLHEVDPFPIPTDWPIVVGWDHGAGGGSDPTAITVRSISPDGTSYYWGEIYDEAVHTTAQRWGMLRALLGQRVLSYPIMRGHDAKQIGTELAELRVASTHPDAQTVMARIIRVTDRLGGGKLKILRGRCPHLKAQFLQYEWDEDHPGKPRDGQQDHALESLGYNELAGLAFAVSETTPDTPQIEDKAVTREWQWFRDRMAKMDQDREQKLLDMILDDDPETAGISLPMWRG